MLERTRALLERHEKRLSVAAFVFGFLLDNLTLTRVDRLFDNIVLLSYLIVAFAAICLVNARGAGRLEGPLAERGIRFARFLLPFAFGGLMSGFLIFYSRSGPVLASAPFLLLLAALFFGNEFLKRHFERFIFQMGVFFIALFSYAALMLPVLLGRMGGAVFALSGAAALLFFWGALRVLAFVAREEVERSRRILWPVVMSITLAFNVLYFNNMIPPIPLSLKDIGVYHGVSRVSGGYALSFEPAPWYALGRSTGAVYHRREGEPVYVWSSVFAPTRLATEVLHRWSYYEKAAGEWVSASVVGFPIFGGRDRGYRGYSVKENIAAGRWRVDVETLRGQIIGRLQFRVEDAVEPPPLVQTVL